MNKLYTIYQIENGIVVEFHQDCKSGLKYLYSIPFFYFPDYKAFEKYIAKGEV